MLSIFDKQLSDKLALNYSDYLDWLDDIGPDNFFRVATTNVNVRNKEDWYNLGREVYDKSLLIEHCSKLIEVISKLNISEFVAEHEYKQFKWLPENNINMCKYNEVKTYLIKYIKSCSIEGLDSKLFISQGLSEFLPIFIDYPFLLKYRNIDLISLDISLIIQISHHLSVDFISSDRSLIEQIISLCNSVGLGYEKSNNLR